jgi:hypothetical protein
VQYIRDCPQQGFDLNCGVFVLYFVEQYAIHSKVEGEAPDMDAYRAHVAANILMDRRCIRKEEIASDACMKIAELAFNKIDDDATMQSNYFS